MGLARGKILSKRVRSGMNWRAAPSTPKWMTKRKATSVAVAANLRHGSANTLDDESKRLAIGLHYPYYSQRE
jgi:hypothetical protein